MATDENSKPAMTEPVGQQLQKAREASGLNVSDVAGAQHLRPSVIQAIESGDYSQIDSELFLKGYVRAYAKQVGLDADAVIAGLDQELEPIRQQREQEHEANPLVDIERRRRRKRQLAKTLFFLVILGIAGYLTLAFLMPEPETGGEQPEAISAPEALEGQSENAEAPVPEESTDANLEVSVRDQEDNLAGPYSEEGIASEQPGSVAEPDERDSENLTAGETSPEALMEQVPTVVQTPDPVLENRSGLAEVTDVARLQISFIDDCWVQVSDATGNRLVNSLQRNGDKIDVSGQAPLKVVIGAVDAVESIRFQGEPLDLDGYRVVNNRSEFSLTI
ncbi:RodZ domain-containing protein [Marinobacter sp.]|uniref:RodZ domain-containing protein n=1 Tax=Marinobacter sp. TaxID=50741 RepID=UPI003A948935